MSPETYALACNGIRDHASLSEGIEQLGRKAFRAHALNASIAARLGCDIEDIHEALDAYGIPRLYRPGRKA